MKRYTTAILFFCIAILFSSCSYDENELHSLNDLSGNRILSVKSDKTVVTPGETIVFDVLAANVAGSDVLWRLGNRTAIVKYGESFTITVPEDMTELLGSDAASLFLSKGYLDIDVNVELESQSGFKKIRIANKTIADSYNIKTLSINSIQLAAWKDISGGTPIYQVDKGTEITLDKENINIEVNAGTDSDDNVDFHWYVYSPSSETSYTDSLFFNIYESGINTDTVAFTADAEYYTVYLKASRELTSDMVDSSIKAEDFYFFYIDFSNAE